MGQHPIQGLMQTAMQSIKEMVDVNTIIGDSIQTPDGQVIIPVSKVGFGFAAGGSEFKSGTKHTESASEKMPFGGGSGGGVSITPVAFIVVSGTEVKVLNLEKSTHVYDRIIDLVEGMASKRKKESNTTDSSPQMYS